MYRLLHQPSKNFNPRSRVGSDCISPVNGRKRTISIHAPAWGATEDDAMEEESETISIHAPAWGATSYTKNSNPFPLFQSTLPRGERRI